MTLCNKPALFVQSNRLSCPVEGEVQMPQNGLLLLAPGNQLSLPQASPAAIGFDSIMVDASFMWVHSTLDTHHWIFWYVVSGGVGLTVLTVVLSAVRCRDQYNQFRSFNLFEKALLTSSKLLAPVCALALMLGGWFGSANHLYKCGDPIMRFTLAYISADNVIAAAAVFFSATNLCIIHCFRVRMAALYSAARQHDSQYRTQYEPPATMQARVRNFILYSGVIATCSLVPILSTMAEYLPGKASSSRIIKNIYPLVLGIKYTAGVLLHFISSLIVPYCARKLAGSPRTAVQWMIYSRLIMNQLTAAAVTVWLDHDCQAQWLQILINHDDANLKDIHAPTKMDTGKCLRAVIRNVSELLVSKLLITAFVAPPVYLLGCLECIHIARARVLRWLVWRCPRILCCINFLGYPVPVGGVVSLDIELISLIMLLEMNIVYGVAAEYLNMLYFLQARI